MALVGPTAAGKSALALEVARRCGARILSVDSMQVYRGMDIGTSKPAPDELASVEHGMIDVADPEEDYSVSAFQAEARRFISAARTPVLIVGGSGLHFRAVIDPFTFEPTDRGLREELEAADPEGLRERLLAADPQAGDNVDLANPRRVVRALEILELTGRTPSARASDPEREAIRSYRPLLPATVFGMDPGPALAERIRRRMANMREAGLLDEVARLRGRLGRAASQAVGYKELAGVVEGEIGADEGFRAAEAATMHLARRQRSWFRKDPRITWLPPGRDGEELVERVAEEIGRR